MVSEKSDWMIKLEAVVACFNEIPWNFPRDQEEITKKPNDIQAGGLEAYWMGKLDVSNAAGIRKESKFRCWTYLRIWK